ncbi:MAG: hypothetical protein ABIO70_01415 [Pseudomonadota bacterium]
MFDRYSCAPDTDESGPEQIYHFEVATAGTLDLRVTCDNTVDVDIHVLDGPSTDDCLVRDDTDLSIHLDPGEHWIVADTYVGSYEYAGPYILTGTFSGTLGHAPEDTGDPTGDDTATPPDDTGGQDTARWLPPGHRARYDDGGGCGCGGGAPGAWLGLLGLLGLARRRRHGPMG